MSCTSVCRDTHFHLHIQPVRWVDYVRNPSPAAFVTQGARNDSPAESTNSSPRAASTNDRQCPHRDPCSDICFGLALPFDIRRTARVGRKLGEGSPEQRGAIA